MTTNSIATVTEGLPVRLDATPGEEDDVEGFLNVGVAKHALSLLGSLPDMDEVDVLAAKLG
jgi:hypothetical protein